MNNTYRSKKFKLLACLFILILMGFFALKLVKVKQFTVHQYDREATGSLKKPFQVRQCPTPNYDKDRVNDVWGVILHHTAEPTIERSLEVLTSSKKKVGTHVVIDTDGTRYIMAEPTVVVYHAGLSILNGREGCNYFTIGVEFQGNTLETPLTHDQISSCIDYLLPIMAKYNIPLKNIVTHEMVRKAYKEKYPKKRCSAKVDITQTEYYRFMRSLRKTLLLKADSSNADLDKKAMI